MSAPRLLVIDHDPSVQRAVETTLGAEGCEVTAVGDGLTALDVALATTPDLILADYRMEGTNVFRFLEKLKQKNVLKNVALLLLVNPGDVYDELTLRLVGVTDFLRKPLNPKEMIDRVKRYNPMPAAVPAAPAAPSPAAAQQPAPKIEDLLGWSQDAASPFSELSQDRNAGFDFSLPAAETSSGALDATQFLDRNELTPTDHPTVVADTDEALTQVAPPPPTPETAAADAMGSNRSAKPRERETPPVAPTPPAGGAERGSAPLPPPEAIEGAAKEIARNAVEKVAWDVVPGLAKQSLERVVNEVVERIVWDVVPAIAEAAIKREIERLTRDQN